MGNTPSKHMPFSESYKINQKTNNPKTNKRNCTPVSFFGKADFRVTTTDFPTTDNH